MSKQDELDQNLSEESGRKPPILKEWQSELILFVMLSVVLSVICVFGIVANIFNIVIFYRQGFKNAVNISFFGIAISDFGSLITVQFCGCVHPYLTGRDIPFVAWDILYIFGGLPTMCFARITNCITAFVTVERCMGALVPLKVKRIITPNRSIVIIMLICLINCLSFVPEYVVTPLSWKVLENGNQNKTLYGIVYQYDNQIGARLSFILTPIPGGLSFVVVIVFTIVLVYQLRQKSKWRQSAVCETDKAGSVSTRDKNTMKMVVVIASVLIACNIPGTIASVGTIFESEFNPLGSYRRLFLCVWTFPLMFQSMNASINIFFYYRMSTNYRQSLQQLFDVCLRRSRG